MSLLPLDVNHRYPWQKTTGLSPMEKEINIITSTEQFKVMDKHRPHSLKLEKLDAENHFLPRFISAVKSEEEYCSVFQTSLKPFIDQDTGCYTPLDENRSPNIQSGNASESLHQSQTQSGDLQSGSGSGRLASESQEP